MALNFKQTELELTELVKKDRNNPEIYQKIKDMTFNYLYNVLKPGSGLYNYDDIACDIAADLFLRIQKGITIEYWLNYISRILKLYYLKDYQKKNWSVIIDTTGNHNLQQVLNDCFIDSSIMNNPIDASLNTLYLEQFDVLLNNVLYKTKFKFNSKDRINLQLSVLLTLLKGKNVYFRIDEYLYPYVNIIISKLKSEMINSGLFIVDNISNTLELDPLNINEHLDEELK